MEVGKMAKMAKIVPKEHPRNGTKISPKIALQ